jgi:hypothetical protein
VELLCLPVLKFDETTRVGMANVVVQLLKDARLLVESLSTEENAAVWIAPQDIGKRYALIAGDGLSHERWRSFEKELLELQEKGVQYTKHFRQCSEVLKALRQCILLPGDLHASLFHTLGPVYTVFYGGFIQPIQIALGYKHVDWQKVERAYRQSSILVVAILTRVESRLIETFVHELPLERFAAYLLDDDDDNALAGYLALEFESWLSKKVAGTTDDWFRVVLNFFIQARDYRTVRESIRNGDTIMLEVLHQKFTYVWCALQKPKCFENGLCTMEEFYHDIPYWVLQVIRDNRTGRLYNGRNVQSGQHTVDRAMDEMMEIVQHKYKSMDFPGDDDAFERHSYNMPLNQQCATYAYHQYGDRYDVDSVDDYNSGVSKGDSDVADKGSRKKAGVASKRTQEKIMIDELLTLSGIMMETPGRQLSPNTVWDAVGKATTKLKGSNEIDVEMDEVTREENREEQDISRIVPELEEMRRWVNEEGEAGANTRSSVVQNADEDDNNIDLSTALVDDTADTFDADVDEEGLEDELVVVMNEDGTVMTDTEDDIVVDKHKRKVKKIPINRVALENIYDSGRAKMVKMELPRRRKRRQMREARERKAFHENLFEFLNAMLEGANSIREKLQDAVASENNGCNRYALSSELSKL